MRASGTPRIGRTNRIRRERGWIGIGASICVFVRSFYPPSRALIVANHQIQKRRSSSITAMGSGLDRSGEFRI